MSTESPLHVQERILRKRMMELVYCLVLLSVVTMELLPIQEYKEAATVLLVIGCVIQAVLVAGAQWKRKKLESAVGEAQ